MFTSALIIQLVKENKIKSIQGNLKLMKMVIFPKIAESGNLEANFMN